MLDFQWLIFLLNLLYFIFDCFRLTVFSYLELFPFFANVWKNFSHRDTAVNFFVREVFHVRRLGLNWSQFSSFQPLYKLYFFDPFFNINYERIHLVIASAKCFDYAEAYFYSNWGHLSFIVNNSLFKVVCHLRICGFHFLIENSIFDKFFTTKLLLNISEMNQGANCDWHYRIHHVIDLKVGILVFINFVVFFIFWIFDVLWFLMIKHYAI